MIESSDAAAVKPSTLSKPPTTELRASKSRMPLLIRHSRTLELLGWKSDWLFGRRVV